MANDYANNHSLIRHLIRSSMIISLDSMSECMPSNSTIKRARTIALGLLITFLAACGSSSDNDGSTDPTNVAVGDSDSTGSMEASTTDATDNTDSSNTAGSAGNTDSVETAGATAGTTDNAGTTDIADTTDTAGTTDNADSTDTDDNSTSPNLVAANTFPTINSDGQVTWTFDAVASGLNVVVQPFAELPLASNGAPARWNAMSSFGDRLFIVDETDGRVYEVNNDQAELWFDIRTAIQSHTGRTLNIGNPFHSGVRGIAFHPDFQSNGKFYASIMEQRPADITQHNFLSDNSGIDADSVVVEWTADTISYEIDVSSYRELFRVGVPQFDHPIKQIAFNPYLSSSDSDFGNLYIAHGDGSVESTLAGTGQANDALGKILRINPLQNGTERYSVPADNPFIADGSLPNEVYSYGHRNPHHLAFSVAGHLLAAEAGRDNVEEINLIENGGNYGWALREGAYVHLDAGTLLNGIDTLPADDASNGFVYPAVQFGHHGGVGATFTGEALGGGYVVENGSELDGQFFFVDFPKTGLLFHTAMSDILNAKITGAPDELTNAQTYIATVKFDHDKNPDTPALDSNIKEIVQSAPGYINTNDRVDVRIFQGPNGELYLTSKRNNMMYIITNSLPE